MSTSLTEPTPAALPNPLARYFLATRPAFLLVTLGACLVGVTSALVALLAFPLTLKAAAGWSAT
jgi:hypothetical protein